MLRAVNQQTPYSYVRRVLIALALVSAVLALGLLLRSAAGALLLIFTGILFGVFLHTLAGVVSYATRLPPRVSLSLGVLLFAGLLVLVGVVLVPRVASQADLLVEGLPQSVRQLERWLSRYSWGEQLIQRSPFVGDADLPTFDALSRLTGTFSTLFSFLTNIIFVVFIGLFTAVDPASYRDGIVGLVPSKGRTRAREVLAQIWNTLQSWLLGKLFAMFLIALLTGVGLVVLGMPFALTLGLLAGILELVPFVGPILAAVPAVLVALTEGPWRAVHIALFYLVIQQLEGNLITPLIYKRTIELPPVLMLAAVLVMGTLFGFLGLFVAAPLLAILLVLVRTLYKQDVLGDPANS